MVVFKKENGFPCDLTIETEEYEDKEEGFKGFISKMINEAGEVIAEFTHSDMRARIHWANGFFTALRIYEKK
jgi:hypothetical protein